MGNCFPARRIRGDLYLVKASKDEIVITLIQIREILLFLRLLKKY